jgi:hypothetical protein
VDIYSVALCLIVLPLSFVNIAVNVDQLALATSFVLLPLSLIP